MNPPAGKTVPKMNNQSLKNACFQSPAYFQKSKLYFSKSKPYFFESKVSFFPAPFIPKMNSAIIFAPFGQNRSSVSGFSVIPLPSSPCHPAGRPVSQKTWHTYNVRVRVRAWWTTPWSPVNHAPSPLTARPTILYHPWWRSAPFSARITCRVGWRTLSFSNDTPFRCPRAPPSHPFTFLSSPKRPIPQKNSPFFSLFCPPFK